MLEALEALATADWHRLSHAYGPADDVPELLRALVSPDPRARDKAHEALYGDVLHQGTVYSATVAVVPIMLDLAGDPAVPDRGWLLAYLADVARSFVVIRPYEPEVFTGPRAEWPEWARDTSEAHDAVRRGLSRVVRLLDDPDAGVRRGAAAALASLRDDAPAASEALRARLAREGNQWVRAGIQLGLADLAPDPAARRALLLAAFRTEPGEGARVQLAMRLLEEEGVEDGVEAPAEALACVIGAIPAVTRRGIWVASAAKTQARPPSATAVPIWEGSAAEARAREAFDELARLGALAALSPNLLAIADALQRIPPRRLRAAPPPLLAALGAVEASPAPMFFVLESVAKALVRIAFPGVEGQAGREGTPGGLTSEQRAVLATLAESDTLWRVGAGNMRALLRPLAPLGVPQEREALRRFLAS
jgi:hypothetical protein